MHRRSLDQFTESTDSKRLQMNAELSLKRGDPNIDLMGLRSRSTDGRLRGLDGLRAIAVAAVFLFHADLLWARGGYLGVDLFFVISGFLITSLLIGEGERKGRVHLGAFYWRRAKRLLPASFLMMTAAVLAATIFAPDALPRLRRDVPASLAYATNWELIYAGTSYFETMGRQPLLQHLWSLAIEEQFYIIWAPLIALLLPRFGRRGLLALTGSLAIGSLMWMSVLALWLGYPNTGDPSRLYFGTDTHGFPLLIGAMLGLIWKPNAHDPAPGGRFLYKLVGLGGAAALIIELSLMSAVGEETSWLYPWGFIASATTTVVLIITGTYRGSIFGPILDMQPMRWIGERSYGIYLWHWPIFMLTRPDLDLDWDAVTIFVVRVVLTVGLAALSYRFVELPIRHGFLVGIGERMASPTGSRKIRWQGILFCSGVSLSAFTVAMVLVGASPETAPAADFRQVMAGGPASVPPDSPLDLTELPPAAAVKPTVPDPVFPPEPQSPEPQRTEPGQAETYSGKDLTAIGDSVLLGSTQALNSKLAGATVHAKVGWQAGDVLNQIRELRDANKLTAVVAIHLGTNGYVAETQLNAILSLLSNCKRVLLVNTRVPRRWMQPNNELFDRTYGKYDNVVLVDWRAASAGHIDWFVSDGVHLRPVGQRAFVTEIMKAGKLIS
jgi:peptidoglycan/LPS O-acetylase OafA/YrhL